MTCIAIVQQAPVVLDRAASVAAAIQWAGEAAREGARLVVFPEAFVPGYPAWVRRLRSGRDMRTAEAIHARLLAEAVGRGIDQTAAAEAGGATAVDPSATFASRDWLPLPLARS
jgi:nitrilase